MKGCELCDREARMYCESDQASLCWECDAKVHGANFLVARHTRVLLCRSCQAQTPWRASGAILRLTVSACETCAAIDMATPAGEEKWEEDRMMDEEEDVEDTENDEDSDAEEGDEEDEGDHQVVPWTLTPPTPTSSSSGDESSSPGKTTSGFLW